MSDKSMLNMLGLARRARKLVTGTDTVLKGVSSKKVKLLIAAEDVSDNTLKRLTNKSDFYKVPLIVFGTADELSNAINQQRSVIGVTDSGFAKKLISMNE